MIIGEAVYFRSVELGAWALVFFLFNQLHFIVIEEPGLERRFGEQYRRYRNTVPRWVPRVTGRSTRSP
jgi:protein-S-isoprenylcysteine O-methyltransferase Ste14